MTGTRFLDILERLKVAILALFEALDGLLFSTLPSWFTWYLDKASIFGYILDKVGINIYDITVIELVLGGGFLALVLFQIAKFILDIIL